MFCTTCGSEIPEGMRFCTKCGTPVASTDVQSAPAAQPTVAPARAVRPVQTDYAVGQPAQVAHTASSTPQPKRSKHTVGIVVAVVIVAALGVGGFLLWQGMNGDASGATSSGASASAGATSTSAAGSASAASAASSNAVSSSAVSNSAASGNAETGGSSASAGSPAGAASGSAAANSANAASGGSQQGSSGTAASGGSSTASGTSGAGTTEPFWGVWIGASQDADEAQQLAQDARDKGLPAQVFVTTDWENLNSEKWYVVSVGASETEAAANDLCDKAIDAGYSNAYVKHSGNRR